MTENSHAKRPQTPRRDSAEQRRTPGQLSRTQQASQPPAGIGRRPSPDRRSRPRRWHDAVGELLALQAEYAAWSDALPDSLRDTATAHALQEIIDLDLEAIATIQTPQGYGRD